MALSRFFSIGFLDPVLQPGRLLLMDDFGPSHSCSLHHKSNPSLGGYLRLAVILPGPAVCSRLCLRRDACCLRCAGLDGFKTHLDGRAPSPPWLLVPWSEQPMAAHSALRSGHVASFSLKTGKRVGSRWESPFPLLSPVGQARGISLVPRPPAAHPVWPGSRQ